MDQESRQKLNALRKGDWIEVGRLSELADTVKVLRQKMRLIHARGAYILETETGRRSDTADVAEMIFMALEDGVKKGPPAAVSRKNAKKGGRHPIERGLSDKEARLYWRSSDYDTNEEAVAAMNAEIERRNDEREAQGKEPLGFWTVDHAYIKFQGSGRKQGPRGPYKKAEED